MSPIPDIRPHEMAPAPAVRTATLLERALLWDRAKMVLEAATAAERMARDTLLAMDFADRRPGTTSRELPDGRVVKCVAEMNYATDAERAKACQAKLKATGPEGKVLAERLFAWKPVVAVGELKKLPDKLRKIADAAIDVREARARPSRSSRRRRRHR